MEIRQYFSIARRWAWLLILGLILGAGGGYYFTTRQTPIYQATTRFVLLRPVQTGYDYNSYLESQQLAKTYVQLLTSRPVLDAASNELGYPVLVEQVRAQQSEDSQFIQLVVEDSNPDHAEDIANVLVTALINQNESMQAVRYANSEENLKKNIETVQGQITNLQNQIDNISTATVQDQVTKVQGQIVSLQAQISELETRIEELSKKRTRTDEENAEILDKQANLDQLQPILDLYQQVYTNLVVLGKPVDSTNDTSTRLAQLQTTLNLYQQIYLNLLNNLETVRLARVQSTPTVIQTEPAVVSEDPIRPKPLQTTALAGAVGLMLMAGIAFLVEYLDDTLKTPTDIERVLGVPVIGYIAQLKYKDKSAEQIYVAHQPRSPVSEAFRSLRTNLEYAGVDQPIKTIIVTSPSPAEGKTTIAANLAVIIAQSGKKVVLLDADLRRPRIHRLTGVPNRLGLSDLFRGNTNLSAAGRVLPHLPNLAVIPSGSLPPNPVELLGSEKMGRILGSILETADVVVIDTPPSMVTDAQVLARKADAVLLVVRPGYTHADTAAATLEMFNRANSRIVGVVLNRIPRNRSYYYGGYRYYSPYNYYNPYSGNGYHAEETPDISGNNRHRNSLASRLFRREKKQEMETSDETGGD
ncbi:MAG: polysaccharide biosynthesis tyrosine autokinase [Chloroflexota bacterium]